MLGKVQQVIGDILELGDRAALLTPESPLLGYLPELDSLAVVRLIGALEEQFDIEIYDEEVTAELFASMSDLCVFVETKATRPQGEAA